MKPISLLSLLILFVCFFSSCQKEIADTITGSDSTITTNPALVKRYSERAFFTDFPQYNTKDSFSLNYDNQDRQLSLISVDTSGLQFIYQYSANSITLDQTSKSGTPVHEIFYLNSNLFVDSTLQYNEGDTTTEKYIYNANKQLIRLYEYDYTKAAGGELTDSTLYQYDNAGNLVTETTGTSVKTYTYANHSPNTANIGLNYYQQPKLLPDAYTYTSDNATVTGTHTYTYDSQNRLTSDKGTFSGDEGNGYTLLNYYY